MRLRLFSAGGVAEAMAQVRTELGANALILDVRDVEGGVEISAAADTEPEPALADAGRLATLEWHGVPADLRFGLARGDLEQAIVQTIRFGPLPLGPNRRPVMLTGPPGTGKTLSTVRLAARLVLGGITPMVITTDGKRAGATEQLAAFTRLLGLPLLVANHPASLSRALAQRPDGAPVLIDTAGMDPRSAEEADEIRAFAEVADAHVVLVLQAGLDASEAADLAVAQAECGAVSLVITRLDLARRFGGVVAAAAASRLALAEAGIGPDPATGLVPFTPALLAARLKSSDGKCHAI